MEQNKAIDSDVDKSDRINLKSTALKALKNKYQPAAAGVAGSSMTNKIIKPMSTCIYEQHTFDIVPDIIHNETTAQKTRTVISKPIIDKQNSLNKELR